MFWGVVVVVVDGVGVVVVVDEVVTLVVVARDVDELVEEVVGVLEVVVWELDELHAASSAMTDATATMRFTVDLLLTWVGKPQFRRPRAQPGYCSPLL